MEQEKKGMSKAMKWGIGLSVLFVIGVINSALSGNKSEQNVPPTTKPTSMTAVAVAPPTPTPSPVFDVPSLLGKNIDQVKAILGTPYDDTEPTAQQISLGAKTWDKTFKKDDKELLVTYDSTTRKIVDFFISTDDPSGETRDKIHLLQLGNVKEGDTKYKIEFVPNIKDPSVFTGVKIIPSS